MGFVCPVTEALQHVKRQEKEERAAKRDKREALFALRRQAARAAEPVPRGSLALCDQH